MSKIRKLIIVLSIIMLFSISNELGILKVHAETATASNSPKIQISSVSISKTQNTTDHFPYLSRPNDRLEQISQTIQDDNKWIEKVNKEFTAKEAMVKQLKNEIGNLETNMDKRNQLLKERMRVYQQKGVNMQYLDVILGSTSFRDFINRVGAVSTMMAADESIVKQQETEKNDYKNRKASLEKNLAELSSMKIEFIRIQSQLLEQRQQYTVLKKLSEKQTQAHVVKRAQQPFATRANILIANSAPIKEQGYISTVISVGKRYISNSVYVFGGGRTPSDIAQGRFDCSGFVHWAFAQAGISIGSTTDSIKNEGRSIPENQMQPGDLVFFDTYKKDGHVGIYIGNGKFIGSQNSTGVAIVDMANPYWKNAFKGHVVRI